MKKAAALLALSLTSMACVADWSPQFTSGYYQATLTYNGRGVSVSEPMTSNGYGQGSLTALARPIYALPFQAKTALDDEIRALAAASGNIAISYVSSSISGPIRVGLAGLTGVNAGLNQASVGGLTYRATARGAWSGYGLSAECYVSLAVNDVAAVVTYEPYTGAVRQDPSLTYVQLNPTASASCTHSLDWIPGLGDFITRWAQRYITSTAVTLVNGFSTDAVRQIVPMGPDYLGIYKVIAPGQYVINYGGQVFDVGAYVRNNFASLFTGRSLMFTLGPENRVVSVPGVGQPASGPYTGNVLTVDFSDANTQLTMAVRDVRNFNWRYTCVRRPPINSCIEP
jgi:hypothetical protein